MPRPQEALSNAAIRPSVRPSVCLSQAPMPQTVHLGSWLYITLIENCMLEVEPTGQRVRTATGSGQNRRDISFRRRLPCYTAVLFDITTPHLSTRG